MIERPAKLAMAYCFRREMIDDNLPTLNAFMGRNPQPVSRTASLLLYLVLCIPCIWLRDTAGLILSNCDEEVAAFIGVFAMAQLAGILEGRAPAPCIFCW